MFLKVPSVGTWWNHGLSIRSPKGRNGNWQTALFNRKEIRGVIFWSKKLDNQECLDGDCVVFLMGDVMGVIIGTSVVKPDGDKVGCWHGRILEKY